MNPPVYLDCNATTPVDPRVLEAMLPWLREGYGNPSSDRVYGRRAKAAVATARAGGRADRRPTRRDRLHRLRHRVQQPGPAGDCRGPARQRPRHLAVFGRRASLRDAGYRGAHWHRPGEIRSALAALPLAAIRVRSALFLPGGSSLARVGELCLPNHLAWGGFLAAAADTT